MITQVDLTCQEFVALVTDYLDPLGISFLTLASVAPETQK